MVERYRFWCQDSDAEISREPNGGWVRHDDYARLQEQVEALTAQLAEADRQAEKLETLLDPHVAWEGRPPKAYAEIIARAEAAEAERDRLAARLSENNRWPDPLQSPQAQAIRAGKIDMTEIADLFDKMAREIEFHRAAASENASLRERLEKAEWKAHAGSLSHDEEIATLTARLEALEAALRDLCDWVEHDVGVELPFDARAVLSTNSEKEAGL
jgi:hypothetical protein